MEEKREFVGVDERPAYLDLIRSMEGGTCSPGSAAAILRVSRERIHALMRAGLVRHWRYFSSPGTLPDMIDISIRDLVTYGVSTGRIQGQEDVGIASYLVRQEIERLFPVDEAEQAAIR
jgi:hypothetical protein